VGRTVAVAGLEADVVVRADAVGTAVAGCTLAVG
jgi:hypothetical protein